NFVGIEFRLLLLGRPLRWQRLFEHSLFWLVLLLDLVRDRIGLRRLRLWWRGGFLCRLHPFLLRGLCLVILARFCRLLPFFLVQGFWRFDLGRVLHTPGHLREVFFAH